MKNYALLLFALCLVISCCKVKGNNAFPIKCGAYSSQSKLSNSDSLVFYKAVSQIPNLSKLIPISLRRQVVAGINYCFKCHYPKTREMIDLYVFEPLPYTKQEPMITGVRAQNNAGFVVRNKQDHKVIGRFVSEDSLEYTVEVQDSKKISKNGKEKVLLCAENGQGYVFPNTYGKVKIYKSANNKGKIQGECEYIQGGMPPLFKCVGAKDKFYCIEWHGQKAFVQIDLMRWDSISTF